MQTNARILLVVISMLSCLANATDQHSTNNNKLSVATTEAPSTLRFDYPSKPQHTIALDDYTDGYYDSPGRRSGITELKKQTELVVQDFYLAIARGNCAKATRLWPGYEKKQCRGISNVNLKKALEIIGTGKTSIIDLHVSYKQNRRAETLDGYLTLKNQGNKWVIVDGSYMSKQDVSLAEYFSSRGNSDIPDYRYGGAANPSQFGAYRVEAPYQYDAPEYVATQSQFKTPVSTESWNEPVQTSGELTFGSSAVLRRCWTSRQLRGSSRDKRVRRPIRNPYRKPPRITKPSFNPPRLEAGLQNSIRRVDLHYDEKIVALTFDLCERTKERTGYDATIVNYLRKHKVKATFYTGGKWMHSHPDKAMQLMADPQFEIGNHAWTHGNMRVLRGREMENQILWTQGQYEVLRNKLSKQCRVSGTEMAKIPRIPLTFRFPYGTCSRESLQTLANYGLPAVQWDVVTGDPSRKQSARAIANIVLRKVKPGSIIIAHANGRGRNTAKALPKFIPKLRRRGYRFVTVSELLKSGRADTYNTCYELKQGDNRKYDRIFGKGTE